MSLPNSHKSKIEIPESSGFSAEDVTRMLYKQLINKQLVSELVISGGEISFLYQSIFNIKYQVDLTLEKDQNIWIIFEAKLIRLTQVSLALIVIIAFSSSFRMTGFLWFSAIFTLIFFTINVLVLEKGIQKLIKSTSLYQNLTGKNEDLFSKDQQEWMKNPDKCPACGEDLNIYDQNCPECGLKLPRKALTKPFDVSKYHNKRLSYSYKEKKQKNDT